MGKFLKIAALAVVLVLFTGCTISNSSVEPLPEPNVTVEPTETPETPEATPEETATATPTPVPVNFWASGLKVEDISNNTSRMCTYDMCIFLKLTALKTCSSITIEGLIYNEYDEEVDDFSDELPRLAKGKTRIVEFGTDASEDTDAEIDLDDVICWK